MYVKRHSKINYISTTFWIFKHKTNVQYPTRNIQYSREENTAVAPAFPGGIHTLESRDCIPPFLHLLDILLPPCIPLFLHLLDIPCWILDIQIIWLLRISPGSNREFGKSDHKGKFVFTL